MKALKLVTSEIIVGTEMKWEDNEYVVKYPHTLVMNPRGVTFIPADYFMSKDHTMRIKADAVIGTFEIKDDVITQLKAKVNGLTIKADTNIVLNENK